MSRTSLLTQRVSAKSARMQIVGFEEKVPGTDIEISELSGLTLRTHDGNNEVTLVGDGGNLYHARVHLEESNSGKEILEFHEAFKLEVPPNEPFIDSESIASYCPEIQTNCTYIIGAEHDNATRSGIYEYNDKGELLNANPFPLLQASLPVLGFSDANQQLNGGYEALSVSEDNQKLVFSTEYSLKSDRDPRWRRLVSYEIESNIVLMYKYAMQSDEHGLSDLAIVDKVGLHIAFLERSMNNSRIYHAILAPVLAPFLVIDLNKISQWSEETVTAKFAQLTQVVTLPERPVYDDTNDAVRDNYEGLLLVRPTSMLMVTDNNEDAAQQTIINLLNVSFEEQWQVTRASDYLSFGFYLLLLLTLCLLGYCFLSVSKRRGRRDGQYHDNIMDSAPGSNESGNLEMRSLRREEEIQLT